MLLASGIDRVFRAGVHHAHEGVTEVHRRGALALLALHGEQGSRCAAPHPDLDDVTRHTG